MPKYEEISHLWKAIESRIARVKVFSEGLMAARSMGPKQKEGEPGAQGLARLVPTQKRSRERFERILACAAELMAEKGSEAFRMSDIVERTGIAFGSLYQYFPDKTAIIGTLAERYNAIGHDCVRRDLAAMKEDADLHAALCRITDSYYQMFVDEPVMRDIWQATQADRALQKLDEEDGAFLAGLLADALRNIAPGVTSASLSAFSQMTMILIAAAVRHAITLPPKEGRRILTLFKRILPKDLSALEA
jgi:AcrR family transcriptional regulator